MPLIKEIKIKVAHAIWDDPKYCGGGYFYCRNIGNMVFCRLFKKGLRIIKNDDAKITLPIKCAECKEIYKKVIECKATAKAYNQSPKYKAYKKKWRKTKKAVDAQRAYQSTPESKAYQREYYKRNKNK